MVLNGYVISTSSAFTCVFTDCFQTPTISRHNLEKKLCRVYSNPVHQHFLARDIQLRVLSCRLLSGTTCAIRPPSNLSTLQTEPRTVAYFTCNTLRCFFFFLTDAHSCICYHRESLGRHSMIVTQHQSEMMGK